MPPGMGDFLLQHFGVCCPAEPLSALSWLLWLHPGGFLGSVAPSQLLLLSSGPATLTPCFENGETKPNPAHCFSRMSLLDTSHVARCTVPGEQRDMPACSFTIAAPSPNPGHWLCWGEGSPSLLGRREWGWLCPLAGQLRHPAHALGFYPHPRSGLDLRFCFSESLPVPLRGSGKWGGACLLARVSPLHQGSGGLWVLLLSSAQPLGMRRGEPHSSSLWLHRNGMN